MEKRIAIKGGRTLELRRFATIPKSVKSDIVVFIKGCADDHLKTIPLIVREVASHFGVSIGTRTVRSILGPRIRRAVCVKCGQTVKLMFGSELRFLGKGKGLRIVPFLLFCRHRTVTGNLCSNSNLRHPSS